MLLDSAEIKNVSKRARAMKEHGTQYNRESTELHYSHRRGLADHTMHLVDGHGSKHLQVEPEFPIFDDLARRKASFSPVIPALDVKLSLRGSAWLNGSWMLHPEVNIWLME